VIKSVSDEPVASFFQGINAWRQQVYSKPWSKLWVCLSVTNKTNKCYGKWKALYIHTVLTTDVLHNLSIELAHVNSELDGSIFIEYRTLNLPNLYCCVGTSEIV
jgi:hypothetical protein